MASKNIFGSMGGIAGKIAALPTADTQNRAGGFSDQVFSFIADVSKGLTGAGA